MNQIRQTVKTNDDVASQVESFKYIRSLLQKRGGFQGVLISMIKCVQMKWRELSDFLCDKRIPIGL